MEAARFARLKGQSCRQRPHPMYEGITSVMDMLLMQESMTHQLVLVDEGKVLAKQ